MHLPVPKAGLIGLSALFALVAAVAVFIYSGSDEAEAAPYAPTSSAKFCNGLDATFPTSKPITDPDLSLSADPFCTGDGQVGGAAADLTVEFTVPAGNSNFGSSVVTNVPGTLSSVPVGQKVGGLRSDITLGLINGPCTTPLIADFVLYSAAVSGTTVAPLAEGTVNRFSNIVTDTENLLGVATADEIADPSSPGIQQNVGMYETLFTPTGGSYIAPFARYTGSTRVPAGGDWQFLSFFQLSPGSLNAFATNASDEPHIFGRVSHAPTDGNLSLSILNDPTAIQISPSAISDFCTPLFVRTMLMDVTPGGHTRYTAPANGTYGVSNFSYGQRDADNDGKENSYDSCIFAPNSGVDSDGDGIDDACDPGAPAGNDQDGDGFVNLQDNCPLNANGGAAQRDNEDDPSVAYITSAPDGGPKGDDIGDICDPDDLSAVSGGGFVQAYTFDAVCIDGAADNDADNDGYCAAQDPNDADFSMKGWTLNKGMDPEYKNGDGSVGDHGDRAGGNNEVYWGSDPVRKCGVAGAWPYDLFFSNKIDTTDVLQLKPVFGGTVAGGTNPKFDLFPSGKIDTTDVLQIKPVFGLTCNP